MPECLLPTQGTGVYNYRFVYTVKCREQKFKFFNIGRTGQKYCFKKATYSLNRKCNQLKKINTTWLYLVLPGTVRRRENIFGLIK
jgi:hypothetical protein